MKSIDETELQRRFSEILDAAERQSIVVRRQGKDVAAIVSIADYERLRAASIESFLQLRNAFASEAATGGLTEGQLAEILADDET